MNNETFELTLNNKPITFTIDTYTNIEQEDLYAEAKLPDDIKTTWKSIYYPNEPEKQIYKHQKELDQLYEQIEKKLTSYIKTTYPDMNLDWNTVVYQETLSMDNNFKMSLMIDE